MKTKLEPTAGLDPNERIRITNYISGMAQDKIVIFATHVISDIESFADRITLLTHGRLVKAAPTTELQESITGKVYEGIISKEDAEKLNSSDALVSNMHYSGNKVKVRIISEDNNLSEEWKRVEPELSDVYLYYEQENE